MKLSTAIAVCSSVGMTITSLPAKVHAACSEADAGTCQPLKGSCTNSLEKFLSASTDPAAISRADIFNTLSYGNYCGASTKCLAENITPSQGDVNNAPAACNDIDGACQQHDACLDALKATNGLELSNGQQPNIDFPLRCTCEYGIIADLYAALQNSGGTGGLQLCDQALYDNYPTLPESFLLATPFCFAIRDRCTAPSDCTGSGCATDVPAAIGFCQFIGTQLAGLLGGNPFGNIGDFSDPAV